MRVIFLLARHYWANGETATWQVAQGFDPGLIDWIKQHYTRLELERPPEDVILGRPVVFEYRAGTDVFGRGVTEITAATVRRSLPGWLWRGLRLAPRLARVRERLGRDRLVVEVPVTGAVVALILRGIGRATMWLLRGMIRVLRGGVIRGWRLWRPRRG